MISSTFQLIVIVSSSSTLSSKGTTSNRSLSFWWHRCLLSTTRTLKSLRDTTRFLTSWSCWSTNIFRSCNSSTMMFGATVPNSHSLNTAYKKDERFGSSSTLCSRFSKSIRGREWRRCKLWIIRLSPEWRLLSCHSWTFLISSWSRGGSGNCWSIECIYSRWINKWISSRCRDCCWGRSNLSQVLKIHTVRSCRKVLLWQGRRMAPRASSQRWRLFLRHSFTDGATRSWKSFTKKVKLDFRFINSQTWTKSKV